MSESEPRTDGRTERETTEDETESGAASPREAMEKAGPNSDVPDEAIASLDDFTVQRDAEGERLPVTQKVPGREQYVRVIPINQGEANEYLPESGDVRALDDDATLELLQEFYVEPSFESVESLDDIKAFGLDPLLMALMNASGFDMTMGMVGENSELVEMVEGNSRGGN